MFSPHRHSLVFPALLLCAATLVVYLQVLGHDFIIHDDTDYVTENRHVQGGIDPESLKWAFTTTHGDNWHPLTWLSHMADVHLFGLNPSAHHLTNLMFHLANTLLLFAALTRMSGAPWPSALVAMMFSVHPLHVESVAWVAERKDVLSTFFFMLALFGYARYAEQPGKLRYAMVAFSFALALMSKPMVVTFPFVLLLVDYWPLGRLSATRSDTRRKDPQPGHYPLGLLLLEKSPLFIMSAALAIVTLRVENIQTHGYPIGVRVANAVVSYIAYLAKTLWPFDLAHHYPHPGMPPLWQTSFAGLLLIALSALALVGARRYRFILVGWLWYIGTLAPVIGLVQVGTQARADRYTYIPLIGIFIAVSWALHTFTARHPASKRYVLVAAGLISALLMIRSWHQTGKWINSDRLNRHALAVTDGNYIAYNNLGMTLADQGRLTEAIASYSAALHINPGHVEALNNKAVVLARLGRTAQAMACWREAIGRRPGFAKAHNNLGGLLYRLGDIEEAIVHFQNALRIQPEYAGAHGNLGSAYAGRGQFHRALNHYRIALGIDPSLVQIRNNMGAVYLQMGRLDAAVSELRRALLDNPESVTVYNNLGAALLAQGKNDAALSAFQNARRLQPDSPRALYNLARIFQASGHYEKAIRLYEKLTVMRPDRTEINYDISRLYALLGKFDACLFWLKAALQKGYDPWDRIEKDAAFQSIRSSSAFRALAAQRSE